MLALVVMVGRLLIGWLLLDDVGSCIAVVVIGCCCWLLMFVLVVDVFCCSLRVVGVVGFCCWWFLFVCGVIV